MMFRTCLKRSYTYGLPLSLLEAMLLVVLCLERLDEGDDRLLGEQRQDTNRRRDLVLQGLRLRRQPGSCRYY